MMQLVKYIVNVIDWLRSKGYKVGNDKKITQANEWYLKEVNGEYFAEKITKLPQYEKPTTTLFRDYNNKVMSLGKDKTWAIDWIQRTNEINKI